MTGPHFYGCFSPAGWHDDRWQAAEQRFACGLVCSPHPASSRLHLTMNTLAYGYILPTTGRIWDLPRWKRAPLGAQQKIERQHAQFFIVLAFNHFPLKNRVLKITALIHQSANMPIHTAIGPK